MTKYSHSKLTTFEQCKYKYKLKYIDKVKVEIPTTIEAFIGDLVHRTLEKLHTDLKYQKLNELNELLKFYNELWEKEYTIEIRIVKDYSQENYKKMGEKFITVYYNKYKPFDQITILGLETEDILTLPDGNAYDIRIDKLGCKDNIYYICDYKTNNKLKNQEEADSDRQLAMYSIWVKNKFKDAKKVFLLWHMLAFDKEIVSERSDEELKKLQEKIISLIKEIENCKNFPQNVTKLCDYCDFKEICPSFKHEAELKEKTFEEFKYDDGVKLVDEYSGLQDAKKRVEEKLDELKQKLIGFCEQKNINMIFGSNKKCSVKSYDKVIYPENKEELIRMLKEKGLYEELSSLNYFKLSPKIFKKQIDEDIIKLTEMEKAYRLSLSKRY